MRDRKGDESGADKTGSGDEFDRRLKAARRQYDAARGKGEDGPDSPRSAWQGAAYAMRIGSELVASLIVGVGVGWLLDRWLGTGPWLMALFLFLGAGAGVMNVYRLIEGKDAAIGWKRPGQDRLRGGPKDAADGGRDRAGGNGPSDNGPSGNGPSDRS